MMALITRREREVLEHIRLGLSNKEIAIALGCALKTVESHVSSLLRKCEVDSRLRLALSEQFCLRVSTDSQY